MLPDIDFRAIRPWRGSQHSGFEELCCQLYSLEPPEDKATFFRKEGSGGDAGVECVWTLPNGTVHGLQSKYFLDSLGPSQWSQIDHSVRTAVEKHPTLSRYTVCLPRDLTDRRRDAEKSQRDMWEERVEKWTAWATAKGINVEFVFWGTSELSERLTRDEARYSGRTLFWFGTQSLTSDWFRRKFDQARANLDRRYTPEANVDLPAREIFDGLCRTPALAEDVRQLRKQVREANERCASALRDLQQDETFAFDLSLLQLGIERLVELLRVSLPPMWQQVPARNMAAEGRNAVEQVLALQEYLGNWKRSEDRATPSGSGRPLENARYFVRRLERALSRVSAFADSKKLAAANLKALLVEGDAGMGKSHMLADVAQVRLNRDWPTVLLLGQHVDSGNPWDAFLSGLDLRDHSVDELLGALDAAGQAAGVRSLVLVDAINEGGGRQVWKDQVAGFLAAIERFSHVAVALSCRTTYVSSIFPAEVLDRDVVSVTHRGFEGHESAAAAVYLDRYGIARPNTPLLSPEFSNPLFLKTCCEALNRQGKTSFPRGMRGVKSIFALYLDSLDRILLDRLDVDPHERIGGKALRRIAGRMAEKRRGSLPWNEAKALLEELLPARQYSESLLNHLLTEGALAEDLLYPEKPGDEPGEIVRFTFERFSDHFIAERLLENVADHGIERGLAPDAPLGALLRDPTNWHLSGAVEALAIQVPERYGRELIALLDGARAYFDLGSGFLKSVIWRDPAACTDETAEWLGKVGGHNRGELLWNTLLHVAAEPDHPFNADRLHSNLMRMDLPDRDELWSIYLAQYYWEEGDGEPESVTRTLVQWAWETRGSGADDETARLCAVALAWFFTTSNRVLRDHATKALVALIAERPVLALRLLDAFESVNDPYVAERVHAAIYGAVLQGVPDVELNMIAMAIYEVFRDGSPPPHILLRDYARGTIEYAYHRDCLPDDVNIDLVRPPYSSDQWPLEFPTEKEVEESEYDSIRSSVLSMGDFGRYIMGDSSDWSVSQLREVRPETHDDRVKAFLARIADDPNPELKVAFEALAEAATPAPGEDPGLALMIRFVKRLDDDDALQGLPGRAALEGKAKRIADAEHRFLGLLPAGDHQYFQREIRPYLDWGPQSHVSDRPVRFDIMDERRWVWRRAHSLGWTSERFSSFERMLTGTRQERGVERFGKKYQWIAWHELQARLSDHLYFIGDYWHETGGSIFEGPWQIGARDVDPTLLLRTEDRRAGSTLPGEVWWRPVVVEHPDESTEERVARLWSDKGFPEIQRLLSVRDPDGREWLVLNSHSVWRDQDDDDDPRPRRDTSLGIHSFIVSRLNVPAVVEALTDERGIDSAALRNPLEYYAFLGEHPWHPVSAPELDQWRAGAAEPRPFDPFPVSHLIPTVEYVCEPGRDQSVDERVDLLLPGRELREHLDLRWDGGRGVTYRGPDGSVLYVDPTTEAEGPSAVLVSRHALMQMLVGRDLALVWWIYGEKGLYGRGFGIEFFGRQALEGVYYTEGMDILGRELRREQRPHEE